MAKNYSSVLLGLAFLTAASVPSCGSAPPLVLVEPDLVPLLNCGDAEARIRAQAIAEMNRQLDVQIRTNFDTAVSLRASGYCARHTTSTGSGSGTSSGTGGGYSGDAGAAYGTTSGAQPAPAAVDSNDSSSSATRSEGASQVSGTNNQVASVDEADFVKNDNQYIYVVAGGAFRIIKAWPATEMHEIARFSIEGTPKKLFVSGDRALIYSSVPRVASNSQGYSQGSSGRAYSNRECTYGYDCTASGDGNATKLTILDISARTSMGVVREVRLSGSFIAARRVGDAVHTVVTSPGVAFSGLSYYDPEFYRNRCDGSPEAIIAAGERLRARNKAIIVATPLADLFPNATDTVFAGGASRTSENLLGSCGGFYSSRLNDGTSFTSVVSLDMARDTPIAASTVVSRPGVVYASAEALYISVPRDYRDGYAWFASMQGQKQASDMHKFELSTAPAASRYVASGVVKGRVLNQFALDERDGFLRVATSSGRVPDPSVHSTLSVFKQDGALLVGSGAADNLAPHEDIRSVRFSGDRGYMVTFKKTDPLFVFDLADPSAPRVLAELKIPGFSTYMHMLDAGHLLTIGYDAEDHGSFAYFSGVLIQIFDVTTPTDPRLVHRNVIGTRGSSSEALTNHLAFTYFAPKKALALPLTICESRSGTSLWDTTMTFSGLLVFDISVEDGIKERGRVAHPAANRATGCGNWWTNASSEVRRSIFMDDFVFSLSESRVKANNLDALATDVAEVPFAR